MFSLITSAAASHRPTLWDVNFNPFSTAARRIELKRRLQYNLKINTNQIYLYCLNRNRVVAKQSHREKNMIVGNYFFIFYDIPHFVWRDIFTFAKVILRLWRSDIIFASLTAVRQYHSAERRISLRSNRTRRKANITKKTITT